MLIGSPEIILSYNHNDMLSLLLHHGTYAQGTKKANGPITEEDLNDRQNTKEYAVPTIKASSNSFN